MNYDENNVIGQYKNAAQGLKYKFIAELVAIACAAFAQRSIFSATSAGMLLSVTSCTS